MTSSNVIEYSIFKGEEEVERSPSIYFDLQNQDIDQFKEERI